MTHTDTVLSCRVCRIKKTAVQTFSRRKQLLIVCLVFFAFQASTSNGWFSTSDSNLCPSPVDRRQFSCRHLMVCLQLFQQSACATAAYHHSSRLCMLSDSELLSPCPSPGYKTYINSGQDNESTHLTDVMTHKHPLVWKENVLASRHLKWLCSI